MPEEIVYANEKWAAAYRAEYPTDHTDASCDHEFRHGDAKGSRCGLPVWTKAEKLEPRCEFHTCISPGDLRERLGSVREVSRWQVALAGAYLVGAPLTGAELFRANLAGADLTKARLAGANLYQAHLEGAELLEGRLEDAGLSRAHLQGASLYFAHLERARLDRASLEGAALLLAHLEDAELPSAHLEGANVRGAHLQGADLRWAYLGKHTALAEGDPIVTTTDLRGAHLLGAKLASVTWPRSVAVSEWTEFGPSADQPARDCVLDGDASAYRQLKLCFQESGLYARAGAFFVHERRAFQAERLGLPYRPPPTPRVRWSRAAAWIRRLPGRLGDSGMRMWRFSFSDLFGAGRRAYAWLRRRLSKANVWDSFLYHLCRFGEDPARAALWGILLILGLGFWQKVVGVIVGGNAVPSHDPWTAFHFSVVTFTTLGYGNITPNGFAGHRIAEFEALCGVLLVPILMICLVREFSR